MRLDMQVRGMLQQLPGGPSESLPLQQLLDQATSTTSHLASLTPRCVPRPSPPQYLELQQEVSRFASGIARPEHLQTLAEGLAKASRFQGNNQQQQVVTVQGLVHQAGVWDTSATAWCEQLRVRFPEYVDLLQPVELAVLEVRHGLALLKAAAGAAQQAAAIATAVGAGATGGGAVAATAAAAGRQRGSKRRKNGGAAAAGGGEAERAAVAAAEAAAVEEVVGLTAGLLSFPVPLQPVAALLNAAASAAEEARCGDHDQQQQGQSVGLTSSISSSSSSDSGSGSSVIAVSSLMSPQLQGLLGQLLVGARKEQYIQGRAAAAGGGGEGEGGSSSSVVNEVGQLAAFQWQLESCHLGLVAAVQEALMAGPGVAAAASGGAGGVGIKGGLLSGVHNLCCELLGVFRKIKEFEEAEAEEAAQLFKTKTQTSSFMTEEVRVQGGGAGRSGGEGLLYVGKVFGFQEAGNGWLNNYIRLLSGRDLISFIISQSTYPN